MIIIDVKAKTDFTLQITCDDGRQGTFDVNPYLKYEAFTDLRKQDEFTKIMNGGYFIEWDNGADLSTDTIEAHLVISDLN